MSLETYNSKRDFTRTREPKGDAAASDGHSFVIQKHAARRLHYDFRLELDGVLKSWAVARGPSLSPEEKRLAVQTEDHPLDYGGFEGTIPAGEYGGGEVIVWDRGDWEPVGDPHKGLAKGHLEFVLHGEKLQGTWHLVRMHRREGEKRDNWLLIKVEDEWSRAAGSADILDEKTASVLTGRGVEELKGEEPGWSSRTGKIETPAKAAKAKTKTAKPAAAEPAKSSAKRGKTKAADTAPAAEALGESIDPSKEKGARKAPLPDFVEPALATLVAKPPVGARWIHEIKFDGYRLQARIEAGRVKLLTRSGLDWTQKFGKAVVAALADLPLGTALIDGELVVESGSGASDFSALQEDLSEGRSDRFVFYLFDLIHLDGYDLQGVALHRRKALLNRLVPGETGMLRFSGHFEASGETMLKHACRLSLEGIVSKVADAPYHSGRGKGWVKSKCTSRQEFVIGGWIPSSTSRKAVGSLALGVYEEGKLKHVGRVGTGFTRTLAESLMKRMERLRADSVPFDGKLTADEARGLRAVRPELVAEVEFRGWTGDGHLRHASFRGLREDKPAIEIVREVAKGDKTMPAEPKRTVKLTHPDRVYWPDVGVTKEGLADYYAQVWRYIAPFITGRPLALLRGPDGITGQHFFQKHAWKGLNSHIGLIEDPADPGSEPLITLSDLDGLIGLVQAATLEIHPWGSTVAHWEKPDMIIMDLDPGPDVPWEAVIDAARQTRERLEALGLAAFVKTSGGKGLHVVSPLEPKAEWPAIKAFTKGLADQMAADDPDHFVSTIAKAKRQGRILVDYLRNQRGQTAVAPYSTRARPGAPVSMPLSWDELDPGIGPNYFTVNNALTRLENLKTDPWADFRKAARPLPAEAKKPAAASKAKAKGRSKGKSED